MIEIRVPAYKRPELLKRALSSVLAQTSSGWRCIVLDDSPANEGAGIVKYLNDCRIKHLHCSKNIGLLANLRFAFSPHPFFEESRYACVLEDDNYYRPNFISNAMRRLEQSTLDVFCGNSQIAQLSDSGSEIIEERYTLSPIYGDTIREIDLIARLRAYLHGFPVTNLSLVWRLNAGIDFSISDEQYNQIAQEKRRAFAWRGPMIYDPEPNSIWTNFCDRQATATTTRHSRLWRLGDMTIRNGSIWQNSVISSQQLKKTRRSDCFD
jgi:glycosyltransferase involved in cell wall biosynthesis